MTTKLFNFRASDWAKRLAQSLASLKEAEEKYGSELSIYLTDDNSRDIQILSSPRFLFENRYFLYHNANNSKNSPHYRVLCSALDAVKVLLRKHPSLNRALGSSDDNEEIRICIANSLRRISLIDIVARLMSREAQVPRLSYFRLSRAALGRRDSVVRWDIHCTVWYRQGIH